MIRWIVAGQDLFADELATYWVVSTHSLSGVVDTVSTTAEITPPLGFMLAWLGSQISLAPEAIRLPALLAGIVTIPLVYAIGLRTTGRAAALAAATFTALSPFMIFYSAEARGYGVMMAFVLASTWFLLKAVDEPRARWWVGYGVFVALAAYTHYTSIFVLGAQFLWALWLHPPARKPLLIATALAALAYVPWLPSLKGDIDSPTTEILGALSPFDLPSIKLYLGHWLFGFPYPNVAGLRDLPGLAGLLLIGAGLVAGAAGLWSRRETLRRWFASQDNRIILLVLLALATPLAEAFASLLSTNIFSTRNLAASWPYLALATAALITVGKRPLRIAAAALVAVGLGLGAAKMVTTGYERPNYTDLAEWVKEGGEGVVVDAAAFTPGPLANFDVEETDPGVPVFRLNIPEQTTEPFDLADRLPDPADVAARAAEAADGGPIIIVSTVDRNPIAGARTETALAAAFIADLPGYALAERKVFPGFLDPQALVYEPTAGSSGSGAAAGSGSGGSG